jgi:hypothetical protein
MVVKHLSKEMMCRTSKTGCFFQVRIIAETTVEQDAQTDMERSTTYRLVMLTTRHTSQEAYQYANRHIATTKVCCNARQTGLLPLIRHLAGEHFANNTQRGAS